MAGAAASGRAVRPSLIRAGAWLLALTLLAGCASNREVGPSKLCPRVDILEFANELVRFLPGLGRDVTDVVFRTRLVNFRGACEVDENEVEVELVLEFVLESGPANRSRKAAFEYFVAIPQFHPQPAGKRRFAVLVEFANNQNRALYRDEISVQIPLKKGQASSDFNIFVGFQVSEAELEYNRRGIGEGASARRRSR